MCQGCAQFFLPGVFNDGRAGRGEMAQEWENLSGKFALVAEMLRVLFNETDDRVVIVSNYTQVRIAVSGPAPLPKAALAVERRPSILLLAISF